MAILNHSYFLNFNKQYSHKNKYSKNLGHSKESLIRIWIFRDDCLPIGSFLKTIGEVPLLFSHRYDVEAVLAFIEYYLIENDEEQHSQTNTVVGKVFK